MLETQSLKSHGPKIRNMNNLLNILVKLYYTAPRVSKYGVFSGPYFPVFGLNSPNTGKCGPEKTSYLDTFYTVLEFDKNSLMLC